MDACSMSLCENTTANCDELFHPFPTDFKICLSWVKNCGKQEYVEDFSYLGAYPFINKKICSAHFSQDDFKDPENKSAGLKENAVPKLNSQLMINPITDLNLENAIDMVSEEDSQMERSDDDNETEIKMELTESNDDESDLLIPMVSQKVSLNDKKLDEQTRIRREKNALRAALKRQAETPEQRAERKLKDLIRSAKRRASETELQKQIRRYNDAVRAAYRRSNETEEQRQKRRMIDIMRASKRRQSETAEQRAARLKADRERAARRRMMKKLSESGSELSSDSFTSLTSGIIADSFSMMGQQISLSESIVQHLGGVSDPDIEPASNDSLNVRSREVVS